jgi:aldose 1-epimerase
MNDRILEITDRNSGSSARILAGLGFNCFRWQPVLDDGPREMLWADAGFEAGDKRPSGSGIPLLFPFPGRIGGAVYRFEGREYRLEPSDAFGNAIHGFVFNRPWRVIDQTKSKVVGEFQASVDDKSILERWPSDFRIQVSYEVRGRELVSSVSYANTGAGPLPCGFATHAYFRLPLTEGGDVAKTVVTVPAKKFWELERMVPTGKILAAPVNECLAGGLQLADHRFDTAFTELASDTDGLMRTTLVDPKNGRQLTQSFDTSFTQCVVYTPGHREAICMEPYTCVPDAIRLAAEGHQTGLQVLKPGESRSTTIKIDVNR